MVVENYTQHVALSGSLFVGDSYRVFSWLYVNAPVGSNWSGHGSASGGAAAVINVAFAGEGGSLRSITVS
jgi:hypothetical protein